MGRKLNRSRSRVSALARENAALKKQNAALNREVQQRINVRVHEVREAQHAYVAIAARYAFVDEVIDQFCREFPDFALAKYLTRRCVDQPLDFINLAVLPEVSYSPDKDWAKAQMLTVMQYTAERMEFDMRHNAKHQYIMHMQWGKQQLAYAVPGRLFHGMDARIAMAMLRREMVPAFYSAIKGMGL